MTALPVAYYLKELSGEPSRRGGRGLAMLGSSEESEVELQIGEAHARGVLEGRAAAQVDHDAAFAAQAAAFERKLAAERQSWAADQGGRLGELIAIAFDDLELRVSTLMSEVLKPVLTEQIRAKAVETLSQSLNDMLTKGDYAKIAVSGPADLLSALERRFAASHPGLSFVVAEGADVTVSADETILETRIGAWINSIEGTNS